MAKEKENGAVGALTVESIRTAFDRRTSRVHPVADLGRLATDAGWGSRPFGPWSLKMLPYTTRFAHGTITFVDGRSLAMTFTRGTLERLPTNLVGDIMLSHGEGQRWIDLSAQVRVRADGQVFAIRTREDMDQLVVMHRNFAMLWAEALSEAEAIREGMAMPMERELVCNDCRVPVMRPGANGMPLADHDLASFGAGGALGGLGSGLPGLMAGLDEKLAEGTAGTSGPGLDTGSLSLADWASGSWGRERGGGRGMVSHEPGGGNTSENKSQVTSGAKGTGRGAVGVGGVHAHLAKQGLTEGGKFFGKRLPGYWAAANPVLVGSGVILLYYGVYHTTEAAAKENGWDNWLSDYVSDEAKAEWSQSAASTATDVVLSVVNAIMHPIDALFGDGEQSSDQSPTGGDQTTQPPPEDKSETDTGSQSSDDTKNDDQSATDTSETPKNEPGDDTAGVPIDEQAQWDGPESLSMQGLKAFAAFYFALKMNAKAGELVQYGEGDGFDPGDLPEPFRVAPNDGEKKVASAAELKKLTDQIIRRRRQKLGELIQ